MIAPKISIIVPVYNVEQYLSKCILSVLEQTYQDWELLLVNDGSPDNSDKICEEFAQKDNRIRVLHKENGGVSSARNLGLENAKGDYIMFIDSDDWISNDCLEVCKYEIEKNNLDALQFGFFSIYSDRKLAHINSSTSILSGEEYIQTNSFNVCVWGGIYRRKIIEGNQLRFPIELKLAEDQIFVLSFLKETQRIKYLDRGMYYYYQRDESANHSSKSKDMLLSCEQLSKFSNEWPIAKCYIDKMIVNFIMIIISNNDTHYRLLKKIFKKHSPKIKNIDTFKSFIVLASVNFYLGYLYFKCYIYFKKTLVSLKK